MVDPSAVDTPPPVALLRMFGDLGDQPPRPMVPGAKVVLSKLSSGEIEFRANSAVTLHYVAAGAEAYRLGGRSHVVKEESFLFTPAGSSGSAGLGRKGSPARGLCVLLSQDAPAFQSARIEEPIVFSARTSALGALLAEQHRKLYYSTPNELQEAVATVAAIESHIEHFVADAMRSLAAGSAVKPATRYENFRKTNIARAFLHDVEDRKVDLAELAQVAGLSQFQLVRYFADHFGCPPSAYHRRLRLMQARDGLAAGKIDCGEAAYRYGFKDAAHFSRAFKQAFGFAPSKSREH